MIHEKWSEQIQVTASSDGLVININDFVPTQMMQKLKDCRLVKLNIASVVITPSSVNYAVAASGSLTIPFNDEVFAAQTIPHQFPVTPGSVIVSGFSVECLDEDSFPIRIRTGYTPPAKIIFAEWVAY